MIMNHYILMRSY